MVSGTAPPPAPLSPKPTVVPFEPTSCVQAVVMGMFAGAKSMRRNTNAPEDCSGPRRADSVTPIGETRASERK